MSRAPLSFRFWDASARRFHRLNLNGSYEEVLDWTFWGNVTLEQDTGLVDATGRAVFAGDIISFTIKGYTHGPEPDLVTNAQVWYCAEDACWAFGKYPYLHNGEFQRKWWYSAQDDLDRSTLKVIGDIHSTPELLTTHPIIS